MQKKFIIILSYLIQKLFTYLFINLKLFLIEYYFNNNNYHTLLFCFILTTSILKVILYIILASALYNGDYLTLIRVHSAWVIIKVHLRIIIET